MPPGGWTPGKLGCLCCFTPHRGARCSSAWAPASPPVRRPKIASSMSTPWSCYPRSFQPRTTFAGAGPNFLRQRGTVWTADARRYVRASAKQYDVIVSDNFHPARSGSGALYTVEHFRAVQQRLTPSGLFCQWLPLHQLDLNTLRSIVRSFIIVYPEAAALIANNGLDTPVIGLVARADRARFEPGVIRERIAALGATAPLRELGLDDEFAVLGSFVASAPALRRFSAGAEANTDDRPIVAYRAPRITYAPESSPRQRLCALLDALSVNPDSLVAASTPESWRRRLTAYFRARKAFLDAGRDLKPSSSPGELASQVREPLLSVLRLSPDFRPAYDPLFAIAIGLARSDAGQARELLRGAVTAAANAERGSAGDVGNESRIGFGFSMRAPVVLRFSETRLR